MLIDAPEGKQCIKSQVEGGDQGKKRKTSGKHVTILCSF